MVTTPPGSTIGGSGLVGAPGAQTFGIFSINPAISRSADLLKDYIVVDFARDYQLLKCIKR